MFNKMVFTLSLIILTCPSVFAQDVYADLNAFSWNTGIKKAEKLLSAKDYGDRVERTEDGWLFFENGQWNGLFLRSARIDFGTGKRVREMDLFYHDEYKDAPDHVLDAFKKAYGSEPVVKEDTDGSTWYTWTAPDRKVELKLSKYSAGAAYITRLE